MYGKLFATLYSGSMVGSGFPAFALLPYCIANADVDGAVTLNPRLLAPVFGGSVSEVEDAIRFLCEPDPDSRKPAEDGRRLLHIGGLQYRLTSYAHYRAIKNREDQREYERSRKRDYRKGKAGKAGDVPTYPEVSGTCPGQDGTSTSPSASKEGEFERKPDPDPISAEMIASAVLDECRISGRDLRNVLEDVARAELKTGRDPTELRDSLISAYRQYEAAKPRLSYPKGTTKFFGDGDWRNPSGWPWKDGAKPTVNPHCDRYSNLDALLGRSA
jgi:hypothetical protein